jgi:hypothetical protein
MSLKTTRSLVLGTIFSFLTLYGCGEISQPEGSSQATSAQVTATSQELVDQAESAVIGTLFESSETSALVSAKAQRLSDQCPASGNVGRKCGGGGSVVVSYTCENLEGSLRRWTGEISFSSCGVSHLGGNVPYLLTLGPIPAGCSPSFCTAPIPLSLTVDTDEALIENNTTTLHAAFQGELIGGNVSLTLNDLVLRTNGFSCDLSADSAIVCIGDVDGDGVSDATDNCPDKVNPSQSDTDEDGIGDLCDDNVTDLQGEALACAQSLGDSCQYGSDCCDSQFCTATTNVCLTCSDTVSTTEAPCQTSEDCCSGDFCTDFFNDDGTTDFLGCNSCPTSLAPEVIGSILYFDLADSCTFELAGSDCQERAVSGEFDIFLHSQGLKPMASEAYLCCPPHGGAEDSKCCLFNDSLEVIDECAASIIPEPPCHDTITCEDAATLTSISDENNACMTYIQGLFGGGVTSQCADDCCTVEGGGPGPGGGGGGPGPVLECPADCTTTGSGTCQNVGGGNSLCATNTCTSILGGPGVYCASSQDICDFASSMFSMALTCTSGCCEP